MKLQAVLIDDEPIHLQGLRKHIDWDKCGYLEPHCFSSAEQALHAMEGLTVDVVIADINMPGMNGLEMIARLKARKQRAPEFLIISGHDEFQYAQQAISLGVTEYLLKPIKPEEIDALLKKIYSKIAAQRQEDNPSLLLSLVMKNFLHQNTTWSNKVALPLEYSFLNHSFYGLFVNIPSVETASRKEHWVEDHFEFFNWGGCLITWIDIVPTQQTFLLCTPHAKDITQAISLLHTLPAPLQDNTSFQYLSSEVTLASIKELYTEFLFAVRRSLQERTSLSTHQTLLVQALLTMDYEAAQSEAKIFFEKDAFSLAEVKTTCIYAILKSLLQNGLGDLTEWIGFFSKAKDKEEVCRIFYEFISSQKQERKKFHYAIQRTIEYLQNHYSEGITAHDISQRYNINASYFSALFKKETGSNFSDYLMRLRLYKGVELLLTTNLKIHEIAQEIGYQSPAHFSSLFKKIFHCTPNSLRILSVSARDTKTQ